MPMCRHAWVARVLGTAVLASFWGCSTPVPLVLSLSPVDMKPTGNFMVNRAGEVVFFGEGKLESNVYMGRGRTTVRVRAVGDPIRVPVLQIEVDGREIAKLSIDVREARDYSVVATIDRSGIQPLTILVANAWTTVQQITLSPTPSP